MDIDIKESEMVTEIRGNRFCLIDGIKKLSKYEESIVTVLSEKGAVTIRGSKLTLERLTEDRIGVKGKINSITFGEQNYV